MKDQPAALQGDPIRTFEGHDGGIVVVATFPDGKKIATGSHDETIRIWSIEDGRQIKRWDVGGFVGTLAVLKDGKRVVSAVEHAQKGDTDKTEYHWKLWVRDAESGRVVAGPLDGHKDDVTTMDIFSDGGMIASGSSDGTVIIWDTITWERKGDRLACGASVSCVQFSPTTWQLAVATPKDIQIWDLEKRERLAQFNGHADFNNGFGGNFWLAWTHDSAHLFSAGVIPVICCWDTVGRQIGDRWVGHDDDVDIAHITLNSTSTLLASASQDFTVRLWQRSTGMEVARYEHSDSVAYAAFSVDGRFIFSGGQDHKVSQWAIPDDVLAIARGDSLAGGSKADSGPSQGKQKDTRDPLDVEVTGQRRGMKSGRPRPRVEHSTVKFSGDVANVSSSRVNGITNFFNRIRPSSRSKGDKKQRKPNKAPKVVDVPLGEATYGDYVASKEDGIRPYSLFFCLSWFRKKEKKPSSPPQLYDVDLMNTDHEVDILDVPAPTTKARSTCQENIELTVVTGQSQPEAGPSRL